ncbi:hypothetical protein [Sneathiella limimaris]|uniref:hypothetical protein n=1 Tax=Sneathiella limimaris TaxID=1964213 RepID=UPI00146B1D22|nr:hypothetical protein [Sneathiella limimaris]
MSKRVRHKRKNVILGENELNLGEPANLNYRPQDIRQYADEKLQLAQNKPRQQLAFWKGFSDCQIKAASRLYGGFQRLYAGSGVRAQNYTFTPGSRGPYTEPSHELEFIFSNWARYAGEEGIHVSAVLDIVVFGRSCREVDRTLARRKGFARKNLEDGLSFYQLIYRQYTIMEKKDLT